MGSPYKTEDYLQAKSVTMLLKQALLLFHTIIFVSAKIYDRCQLAHELKYIYKFPGYEIPTWICIIAHESIYDTTAMNPGSGDHGLFQISQLYWCSPPGDGFGCNAPCANFRDDNIDDDVQCVKRIFKEHSRISGDGFNAWAVYPLYCKENTTRYINGCFATDNNVTDEVPSQSVSTEEPLDEDDDGYDFPPLPSPPRKISENVISSDDEFYEFPPLPTASKEVVVVPRVESNYEEDFRSLMISKNTVIPVITREVPLTSISAFKNTKLNPTVEPVTIFQSTTINMLTEKITKGINITSTRNKQFISSGPTYSPYNITPRPKQVTYKPFSQNSEIIFTLKPAPEPLRPISSLNLKPLGIKLPKPNNNKLFNNKSTTKPFNSKHPFLNFSRPTLRPAFKGNMTSNTITTLDTSTSGQQSVATMSYDETFSTTTKASVLQKTTKKLVDQRINSFTLKPFTTAEIVDVTTLSTTSRPAYVKLSLKLDNSKSIELETATDSMEELTTVNLKSSSSNRNTLKREEGKYNNEFPGAPVLLSFPHLLYADQEYISSVEGLKPDKVKHESFLTLEPISGFPLQLAQRVQFNMFIRPIEGVESMENISKALVPVLWLEESTILGDGYINMLKTTLFRSLKIFNIVKWVVIIIGLALLMLAFFLFVYMKAP